MSPSRLVSAARQGWFSDREGQLRDEITAFCTERIVPYVDHWESVGAMPLREMLRDLGSRGWLGARFAPEVGGGGRRIWDHVVLAECLGRVPAGSVGMSVTVHNDMVAPMLFDAGTPSVRQTHLRPAIRGKNVLAHAVSEPGAGSDVAAVASTAMPVGDGYRLTGTKQWVVNGMEADAYAVLARLPDAKPPFGFVLLLVEADADGITRRGPAETFGQRSAGVAEQVGFEDVFVPVEHRMGGEGLGLVVQLRQFEQERVLSSCRAVETAEWLLETTRKHLLTRYSFGKALRTSQELQFRLARLTAELHAVRQATYTAVDRWENGRPFADLSAVVKLRSSRLVRAVASSCLHLFGAAGYVEKHPMNRALRDNRLYSISTGSDEMMLTTIARARGFRDG